MDNTYKTVVEGEASESEEEEEIQETKEQHPQVIVQGEASESDEEEIDTSVSDKDRDIPPIRVNSPEDNESMNASSSRFFSRPKYDTILNKRLWESNLSLCNGLNGLVSQTYLSSAKEIVNYSQQLTKSHTAIQDVSHNMRLVTNDLFNLDDRIDIISTCKLLPDIKPVFNEDSISA